MTRVDAAEWGRRIRRYDGDREYEELLQEIDGSAQRPEILSALATHGDPVVRAWAADASVALVGQKSVTLLRSLLKDRDGDVRDIARDHLLDLDPDFKQELVPELHRVLERAKDWYGEDSAAMWRLAKWNDRSAIPILREYATKFPPTDYAHKMPLVLADYLEDPKSVERRILVHEHEWMFWLVEASSLYGVDDQERLLTEFLNGGLDIDCSRIASERLAILRNQRASRDIGAR